MATRSPEPSSRVVFVRALLAVWLCAVSACTLVYDSEQKQCRTNEECAARFPQDLGYSCVESYCVRPDCRVDEDCQSRGGRYTASICGSDLLCATPECTVSTQCGDDLCDKTRGRCVGVMAATCQSAADCARYEGAPLCSRGLCVDQECTTASDCNGWSPSVSCNAGRCEDAIWGCVGQPDERPLSPQPTATLTVPVTNLETRMAVRSLVARACNLPVFDPDCKQPLEGTTTTFDASKGVITVTGLRQDVPFRLKVDFPVEAGLMGLDLYLQKTVRGDTTLSPLVTISTASVMQLAKLFDPPPVLDLEKGMMIGTMSDCADHGAEGVVLTIDDVQPSPGSLVFYMRENGLPAPGRTETDVSGGFGIVNLKAGKIVNLAVKLHGKTIAEMRVTPFARRLTVVRFVPRLYRSNTLAPL